MPKHSIPRGIGERHVGSQYDADEIEFLQAMDRFKRTRPFPTWTEVLQVLKSLGYRKVEPSRPPAPTPSSLVAPARKEGEGNGDHSRPTTDGTANPS